MVLASSYCKRKSAYFRGFCVRVCVAETRYENEHQWKIDHLLHLIKYFSTLTPDFCKHTLCTSNQDVFKMCQVIQTSG